MVCAGKRCGNFFRSAAANQQGTGNAKKYPAWFELYFCKKNVALFLTRPLTVAWLQCTLANQPLVF
jgi:hypothetical protein